MTVNQPWQECSPGDLVRLAGRAKSQLVRRRIIRGGVVAIPLLLVGLFFLIRQPEDSNEPNYGGIRCSVVREHAEAYMAGKVDVDTQPKIAQHLKMCSSCQKYFKTMETVEANRPISILSVERFVSTQQQPSKCVCEYCESTIVNANTFQRTCYSY